METVKIALGGMWDEPEWEIKFNETIRYSARTACKHCGPIRVEENKNAYGGTYTVEEFDCPRVVVAYNEGGYATTGVCLDCILEAAAKL